MNTIKLILSCWCLFVGTTLFAQTNIISNSELENFSCDEGNESCHHFDQCVDDWFISHGSPNYITSNCPDNPDEQAHRFQMVCYKDESEGVMTNVNLQIGTYRLFVRTVVTDIFDDADVHLRISLDRNLGHSPSGYPDCQEGVAETDDTQLIYNEALNDDGEWHWVIVEVEVNNLNVMLDQLMITGLTEQDAKATIGIDCIYLYRYEACPESITFSAQIFDPLVLSSGSITSCGYIESYSEDFSYVGVSAGSQVNFIANDYILLKPNFYAQHSFCARVEEVIPELADDFLPPCNGCNEDAGLLPEPPKGNDRVNEATLAWDTPNISVFPNPASNRIQLKYHPQEDRLTKKASCLEKITLSDATGKVIWTKDWEADSRTLDVDVHDLANGIYLVAFYDCDGISHQEKVVITK